MFRNINEEFKKVLTKLENIRPKIIFTKDEIINNLLEDKGFIIHDSFSCYELKINNRHISNPIIIQIYESEPTDEHKISDEFYGVLISINASVNGKFISCDKLLDININLPDSIKIDKITTTIIDLCNLVIYEIERR